MTVIANAGLVLKDSQGNEGIVKSLTDNDIDKISNAITDVGQVVDPATHMPIEATTASVGVVQLATAQDITNGTANKVVDAKELADVVTKIKYAGSANLNNPFSLFEPKWYPMKISNLSWILSDGSWYDGDIYIGAYNKLVEAYENGTDETDTLGGVTVSYRLSSDGLRVTTDKSSVDSLYSATGTAWYFVIDTTNNKFVLPRSKAFMQFGDEPGKFTEAGLPNITGTAQQWGNEGLLGSNAVTTGAFFKGDALPQRVQWVDDPGYPLKFDASLSNPVYGKSPTVQPNSVTGYLYFYVGDIERDANIINVQELVADLKDQLARFSAAAGENINAVGTPTVTYNDGTFTFNYLKGDTGPQGPKGDTPDISGKMDKSGGTFTGTVYFSDTQNSIAYKSASYNGYKMHDNQTKALYIEGREGTGGDSGGMAITNDGVTIFGAGDTDGVLRIVNEDAAGDGSATAPAIAKVTKDGAGHFSALYVNGSQIWIG